MTKTRLFRLACGHEIRTQGALWKARNVTWCPSCKTNRRVTKIINKYERWPQWVLEVSDVGKKDHSRQD